MTCEIQKGSYVIVSELKKKQNISVGRLGSFFFTNGFYAYVGSAMGGLAGRINRHLRKEKKLHWHIDYLLKKSSVINIITGENNDGSEYQCRIARILIKNLDCIKGFGCSDCKCSSHLFFSPQKNIIIKHVLTAFSNVNIQNANIYKKEAGLHTPFLFVSSASSRDAYPSCSTICK